MNKIRARRHIGGRVAAVPAVLLAVACAAPTTPHSPPGMVPGVPGPGQAPVDALSASQPSMPGYSWSVGHSAEVSSILGWVVCCSPPSAGAGSPALEVSFTMASYRVIGFGT